MPTIHPQVQCGDFRCDEELAELLALMHGLGIRTTNSCQDNQGPFGSRVRRVWVEMRLEDLPRFLELLNVPGELGFVQSLSARMATEREPSDWASYRRDRCWHYDMHVWRKGPDILPLVVSVRFPYSDLSEVTCRLRKAEAMISSG